MKLKLILFILFASAIHVYGQSYAQQDSIDNNSFCQQKKQEFDSLRKIFIAKFDSLNSIAHHQNENKTNDRKSFTRYYVQHDSASIINFDWKGCFPYRSRTICNDCNPVENLDECIAADLYIVAITRDVVSCGMRTDAMYARQPALYIPDNYDVKRLMIDLPNPVNRISNY